MVATLAPVPEIVNAAELYAEPAFPNSCNRTEVPSANTFLTLACVFLLLIFPSTGVSVMSMYSATAPNVP